MPVTIAVGDIYEVKVGCYYAGQAGINVTHWRCSAIAGLSARDTVFAAQIDGILGPAYKAAMGGQATYYGVRVQRLLPAPVTVGVVSATITGVGTFGMSCLPSAVSGLIKLLTTNTGRKGRGRQYIPFPAVSAHDSTQNKPTAAYITAIDAINGALVPTVITDGVGNAATMKPGIYSRSMFSIVDLDTKVNVPAWATQHKRGNYGKANAYPPF